MENVNSEVIISVFLVFGRPMGGGLSIASVPSGALLLVWCHHNANREQHKSYNLCVSSEACTSDFKPNQKALGF